MTQPDCIRQAVARVLRRQEMAGGGRSRQDFEALAREALEPLTKRDQTMLDGKSYAEKWNPETFESTTVEVQLHAPRQVQPYRYGPADVQWLEREIVRRAGL